MANQHRIERLGARFSFLFLYIDGAGPQVAGRRSSRYINRKVAGRRVKLGLVIVGKKS